MFERAHAPLEMMSLLLELSTRLTRLVTPPLVMTKSLNLAQSPAMLPMAQMACSLIPG